MYDDKILFFAVQLWYGLQWATTICKLNESTRPTSMVMGGSPVHLLRIEESPCISYEEIPSIVIMKDDGDQ